jgi:hypothetical protein
MVHYMVNYRALQEAEEALEQPQPADLMMDQPPDLMTEQPSDLMTEQPPDLMAELTAMQTIATALTQLSDGQARVRVLRWAECFSATPGAVPSSSTAQSTLLEPALQSRHHDAMLTLDGFDLFGDLASDETAPVTPRTAGDKTARMTPRAARAAEDETGQMTPGTADEPLESMIKGLVADFQQIARDWHGE